MPSNYYQDAEDAESRQSQADDKVNAPADKVEKDPKDESPEQETALLPSSIFGHDPEVGATCTFEVVHKYGDEIEVRYKDSENRSGSKEGSAMKAFDDNFADDATD